MSETNEKIMFWNLEGWTHQKCWVVWYVLLIQSIKPTWFVLLLSLQNRVHHWRQAGESVQNGWAPFLPQQTAEGVRFRLRILHPQLHQQHGTDLRLPCARQHHQLVSSLVGIDWTLYMFFQVATNFSFHFLKLTGTFMRLF